MRKPFFKNPYNDRRDLVIKICTYPGVRPNYYSISNYGEVYNIKGKLKSTFTDKYGYLQVSLCCTDRTDERNAKGRLFPVHRLVAYEFVNNIYPDTHNIVNHMDCVKTNNYQGNLEHCTEMDNRIHAVNNGLMARGEKAYPNIFSEDLVHNICSMLENDIPCDEIRKFVRGEVSDLITNKQISDLVRHVKNKISWKHLSDNYNF